MYIKSDTLAIFLLIFIKRCQCIDVLINLEFLETRLEDLVKFYLKHYFQIYLLASCMIISLILFIMLLKIYIVSVQDVANTLMRTVSSSQFFEIIEVVCKALMYCSIQFTLDLSLHSFVRHNV